MNRLKCSLFIALLAALAAPALAQQAELDALAAKVAQRISASNKSVVVVVDFTLAGSEHPLGAAVAKEFSAALRRAAPSLKFIDADTLAQTGHKLGFLPMDLSNPLAVQAIALDAGAEVSVAGVITSDAKRSTIGIHITDLKAEGDPFRARLGSEIGTIQSPLTLTPEWAQLRQQPAPEQENGIYRVRASSNFSHPECLKSQCAKAEYNKLARARMTQGVVSLLLTVTPQGDPRDIAVLKHVGDGLTESAVLAVSKWKFRPARLKNGTNVPARVKVDVTFRYSEFD